MTYFKLAIHSAALAIGLAAIILMAILKLRGEEEARSFNIFYHNYFLHLLLMTLSAFVIRLKPDWSPLLHYWLFQIHYLVSGFMMVTGARYAHDALDIPGRRNSIFIALYLFYFISIMANFPLSRETGRYVLKADLLFLITTGLIPGTFLYIFLLFIKRSDKIKKIGSAKPGQLLLYSTVVFMILFIILNLTRNQSKPLSGDYVIELLDCALFLIVTIFCIHRKLAPIQTPPVQTASAQSEILNLLSKREKEVYELMLTSKTYKEIADKLNIAETTVKTHANRILRKTESANRMELLCKK